MIERIIEFSARNRVPRAAPHRRGAGRRRVVRCGTFRSMRSPTSPTRRSSSTRAGTAAPTSSRTRSPIRSSPRCSARRRSRRSAASPTSATRYVYVIFEDGTDLYWARSRVLEYLSKILPRLPEGVRTELGPDATSVGWVYQYALVDTLGQARPRRSCAASRTGTCATSCRPCRASPRWRPSAASSSSTRSTSIPTRCSPTTSRSTQVIDAIRKGNNEVGGRLLEFAGTEYMVRGRGYVRSIDDIEQHRRRRRREDRHADPGAATSPTVALGPDIRRGVADLDGVGDTVGGIVVMRHGENALERHRAREGEARGARSRRCPRASRSSPPTTAPSSSTRSIDTLHARAARGDGHRQPRHPPLPLAHPVGDHPDRHHPGLGLPRLHPDLLHGAHARTSCRSPASPSRSACWSTARSSRSRTPTSGSSSGSPAGGRATSTRCACRR